MGAGPGGAGLGVRRLGRHPAIDPWNVPGRYGWSAAPGRRRDRPIGWHGGAPARPGAADRPVPPAWMRDFWRCTRPADVRLRRCRAAYPVSGSSGSATSAATGKRWPARSPAWNGRPGTAPPPRPDRQQPDRSARPVSRDGNGLTGGSAGRPAEQPLDGAAVALGRAARAAVADGHRYDRLARRRGRAVVGVHAAASGALTRLMITRTTATTRSRPSWRSRTSSRA